MSYAVQHISIRTSIFFVCEGGNQILSRQMSSRRGHAPHRGAVVERAVSVLVCQCALDPEGCSEFFPDHILSLMLCPLDCACWFGLFFTLPLALIIHAHLESRGLEHFLPQATQGNRPRLILITHSQLPLYWNLVNVMLSMDLLCGLLHDSSEGSKLMHNRRIR
jgi:hypothetical protein